MPVFSGIYRIEYPVVRTFCGSTGLEKGSSEPAVRWLVPRGGSEETPHTQLPISFFGRAVRDFFCASDLLPGLKRLFLSREVLCRPCNECRPAAHAVQNNQLLYLRGVFFLLLNF
jgi:hypothetical protein